MAKKERLQEQKMDQGRFEQIGNIPLNELFHKTVLIAAQQLGDEADLYCIFDYVGVRKLKPEDFNCIKAQIDPKYLKQSEEYPRLLFINGTIEKAEQKIRIIVKPKHKPLNKV